MKRVLSVALAMLMVIGSCMASASAAEVDDYMTRGSFYLSGYNATLKAGSSNGKIVIKYTVTSSKKATSIGVKKIEIYKANGAYVTTITGSKSNGLLKGAGGTHTGSYTYSGKSGESYYAVVTLFAECADGKDSRSVTTDSAKAP